MKKLIPLFLIASFLLIFYPLSGRAQEFDNGYIISDQNLLNYSTMSLADIQNFLNRKSGPLKTYRAPDKNGVIKSAAEIIWQASQEYQINPQFILVMLQREQSLLEDISPTQKQYDWAMGYGVCDSCDLDSPALWIHKGFGTQVDKGAGIQRWYIDNRNQVWLKQVGQSYIIDGQRVRIANQVTANLYNYTPHILGNYNFWKIWNRWFAQLYPDGSLLQGEKEPGVWLIQDGMRRPFQTKSALISRFDINKVIVVSRNELNKYEVGQPIKFANYSYLKTPTGHTYLLVNDQLRPFESKTVMRTLGVNPEEVRNISMEDFALYELGEPITLTSAYPTGALLQNKKTGGVYFVQDGEKSPILSKDVMKINYPKYKIIRVSPEELDKYPRQEPVKLREGEIIMTKDSSSVYVVSNGQKRPFPSAEVFETLGYKWQNLKTVSPETIVNLPLGSYIDLDYKK